MVMVVLVMTGTRAAAQPANNVCTAATVVVSPSVTSGTNVNSTSDIGSSSCAFTPTDDRDVWYSFTALQAATFVIDTNGSTGLVDTTLSVWSACPVNGGVELACDDDGGDGLRSLLGIFLNAGQSVRIRVAGWNHLVGAFSLRVSVGTLRPVNDACLSALPIAAGSMVAGTNAGATGTDISSCAGSDNFDVWYSLFAPVSGEYAIDTLGSGTLPDTTLSVFASCGGTELACNDDLDLGQFRSLLSITLMAGQTVLIRVSGYAGSTGTFTLRVGSPIVTSPIVNDLCAGATVLTALPFSDVTTNLSLATDDLDLASCDNVNAMAARRAVWYLYTATSAQAIRIREQSGFGTFIAVFTSSNGTCAGQLTEVLCTTTGDVYWTTSAGTKYFILIGLAGLGTPSGPALLNLAVTTILPPLNDLCANAANVGVPSTTQATTLGATSEVLGTGCVPNSSDNIDVWFRFRPLNTATYLIDTLASTGTLTDTTLSVWSACPAPILPIFCNDDFGGGPLSALNITLTGGVDYYIRASGWNGAFGSFTLKVSPGVVILNDLCATPQALPTGRFTTTIDTTYAATEPGLPTGGCNGDPLPGIANSVWYKFVPGAGGALMGTIDATTYDQIVVVFVGWCGSLTEIACFDRVPADLSTVPIIAGMTHVICIGALESGPGGESQIDITIPGDAPAEGACCLGASCFVTMPALCTGQYTMFAGLGTVCNPLPNNNGPCCRGNFNQTGGISVQDIFDFLSAYFASSTAADLSANGISVQDIFDFLSAYFAGC